MVLEIVVCIILIYFAVWYLASDIRALGENGWVMYYSPNCGHCETQLSDIGWTAYFLPKVNCLTNPDVCEKEGIKAFPTWKNSITGKLHEGAIPMITLFSTLAGVDTVKKL